MGESEKGIEEAIKRDNVYLFRKIPIFRRTWVKQAAELGSLDILSYIMLTNEDEDRREIVLEIFPTENEKTNEWLDKMDLVYYPIVIIQLIIVGGCDVYEKIKKYLPEAEESDDFYFYLGESLTNCDIESRKKIFDLFLENNVDDIEAAIRGAEIQYDEGNLDEAKFREWSRYVRSKL